MILAELHLASLHHLPEELLGLVPPASFHRPLSRYAVANITMLLITSLWLLLNKIPI
jgi:hypothetical protein